jgi:hypothetical protein
MCGVCSVETVKQRPLNVPHSSQSTAHHITSHREARQRNAKCQHCQHQCPPFDNTLRKIHPNPTPRVYFPDIHLNIITPFPFQLPKKFSAKITYAYLVYPTQATCQTHCSSLPSTVPVMADAFDTTDLQFIIITAHEDYISTNLTLKFQNKMYIHHTARRLHTQNPRGTKCRAGL